MGYDVHVGIHVDAVDHDLQFVLAATTSGTPSDITVGMTNLRDTLSIEMDDGAIHHVAVVSA